MRLSVLGTALGLGLTWASAIFLAGVAHLLWPPYAEQFLTAIASIYPGFHIFNLGGVIWGTLLALVDGAIGGAVIAWVHNRVAGRS
jgi:uncharacterized membrane protein YdjX (TVP38/TMEM64 family)